MFLYFFKQKTAYEMRISDWSSDVCSSDLPAAQVLVPADLDVQFVVRDAHPAQARRGGPHHRIDILRIAGSDEGLNPLRNIGYRRLGAGRGGEDQQAQQGRKQDLRFHRNKTSADD